MLLSLSVCGAARSKRKAKVLAKPRFAHNASAFLPILFRGKDSRLVGVASSPCGHGSLSQQSMPARSLTTGGQSDGLCSEPTTIAASKTSSH